MTANHTLDRGRQAFADHRWADAYALLTTADQETGLAPADLEHLATAAYLTGHDNVDHWTRAHQELLRQGNAPRATRCAFWLGYALLNRGEPARGSGWLTRARNVLDPDLDCVEQGYLLLPAARHHVLTGEHADGHTLAEQATSIGTRFADPDLVALARHIQARALIRLRRLPEAVTLLDELMVTVTAGEVSAVVAGDTYCGVIEACHETFDLHRAREWTAALTRWCAAQPGLVPFTGQCQIHRSEILQLHGAWPEALAAAHEALTRFTQGFPHPAIGAAHYQIAELNRLTGNLTEAEIHYRQANRRGRPPQPGQALLRLAQEETETANTTIHRALEDAPDPTTQCRLLPAAVEITLAAGDPHTARTATNQLTHLAAAHNSPVLQAAARRAHGAVLLAEDAPREAATVLRDAWTQWHTLEAPYEAARTRVLIAQAHQALGDTDTAHLEQDAATWAFRQLGATTDLTQLTRTNPTSHLAPSPPATKPKTATDYSTAPSGDGIPPPAPTPEARPALPELAPPPKPPEQLTTSSTATPPTTRDDDRTVTTPVHDQTTTALTTRLDNDWTASAPATPSADNRTVVAPATSTVHVRNTGVPTTSTVDGRSVTASSGVSAVGRPVEPGRSPGGLTGRELEVLRLVAAGGTNRAIAAELFLSEKTVARHVSNIFAKIGVSSRAAATAWVYEQHLR